MRRRPRHIFIVEDNEVYSMMLDYILSKDTVYNFVSFRSGEECLKNLHLHPAVVILDHGLPGMNGYETLVGIKKHDPAIHVVMLTSNQDRELEEKIMAAGADDFVLKQGHGEQQIIEKIEAIIEKDEIEEEKQEETRLKSRRKKLAVALVLIILIVLGATQISQIT